RIGEAGADHLIHLFGVHQDRGIQLREYICWDVVLNTKALEHPRHMLAENLVDLLFVDVGGAIQSRFPRGDFFFDMCSEDEVEVESFRVSHCERKTFHFGSSKRPMSRTALVSKTNG